MKYVKNAVWVRGAYKNPVGLSMYEVHIETVQYTWVNIWCMLDWILLQNCRNVLPLHTVDQTGAQKMRCFICPNRVSHANRMNRY